MIRSPAAHLEPADGLRRRREVGKEEVLERQGQQVLGDAGPSAALEQPFAIEQDRAPEAAPGTKRLDERDEGAQLEPFRAESLSERSGRRSDGSPPTPCAGTPAAPASGGTPRRALRTLGGSPPRPLGRRSRGRPDSAASRRSRPSRSKTDRRTKRLAVAAAPPRTARSWSRNVSTSSRCQTLRRLGTDSRIRPAARSESTSAATPSSSHVRLGLAVRVAEGDDVPPGRTRCRDSEPRRSSPACP